MALDVHHATYNDKTSSDENLFAIQIKYIPNPFKAANPSATNPTPS